MMKLILPSPELLRTAYKRDLIASFPPSELKPLWAIESLYRTGQYAPYCLLDGERLAGECFLWYGAPGWALLDYLCVPEEGRGKGTGAQILQKMLEAEPSTVIFGEAEAVAHAPDPEMARRRLNFYRRQKVRFAGFDSEMFGVHYRLLYWAEKPIPDELIRREYERMYRGIFPPDKYQKYIHIPWDPEKTPIPPVSWDM